MKPTNAVTRVRKYFPQVNKVVDATKSLLVTVKKQDTKSARRKDPKNCALAKACLRDKKVDGAIINIGFSYLIKGDIATRYKTSVGVGREITSFDRHADFASGINYRLSKVAPGCRLGRSRTLKSLKSGPRLTKKLGPIVHTHRTSRIRVAGQ